MSVLPYIKLRSKTFQYGVAIAYGRQILRRIVGAAEPFRNERSECRNEAGAEPRKAGLLDAFAPEIKIYSINMRTVYI